MLSSLILNAALSAGAIPDGACNAKPYRRWVDQLEPLSNVSNCSLSDASGATYTVASKPTYKLNDAAHNRNNAYNIKTSSEYNTLRSQNKGIVGTYVSDWSAYKARGSYFPAHLPVESLTHVLYAFLPICVPKEVDHMALCSVNDCCDRGNIQDGNPYFNMIGPCVGEESHWKVGWMDSYVAFCKTWGTCGLLHQWEEVKKNNPDLLFIPSVGGWSLSRAFFHLADGGDEKMDIFVASCIEFLEQFPIFDGIDIDWEFPGGNGADDGSTMNIPTKEYIDEMYRVAESKTNDGAAARLSEVKLSSNNYCAPKALPLEGTEHDGADYVRLINKLRVAVDTLGAKNNRKYHVTSAVSAGAKKVERINYNEANLDTLFLMSYDFMGAWDLETLGHQTNLYGYSDHEVENIASTVDIIINQGFDPAKLAVGAAMYGRGWKNVKSDDPSQWWYGHAEGAAYGPIEQGITEYNWITQDPASNCTVSYDECTYGGVAVCDYAGAKHYYTLDTEETIVAKSKFIKEKGLAGIFSWVIDQDDGTILNAMARGMYDSNYVNQFNHVQLKQQSDLCSYGGSAPVATSAPTTTATVATTTATVATPPATVATPPATVATTTTTVAPTTTTTSTTARPTTTTSTTARPTPPPTSPPTPPPTGGKCCGIKSGAEGYEAFCDPNANNFDGCKINQAFCQWKCEVPTPDVGSGGFSPACCKPKPGLEPWGSYCTGDVDSEADCKSGAAASYCDYIC